MKNELEKISEIIEKIEKIIESSKNALENYQKQAKIFGESELYRANAHAKIYTIHKMNELVEFVKSI